MKAGVEMRRYTAKPVPRKEFYTEVPFEMELDGPYYSMVNFFDQVGKLERIVDVSGLLVASTKKPSDAKAKHTYQYAPNESVVATCTATTFFSHDMAAARQQSGGGPEVGTAMKLTTGILVLGMAAGTAWGQNPDVIQNTHDTMKALPAEEADGFKLRLRGHHGRRRRGQPQRRHQRHGATQPRRQETQRPVRTKRPAVRQGTNCGGGQQIAAAQTEIAVEGTSSHGGDSPRSQRKPINFAGRRDPFVSPVVNRSMVGSGCSTGKRCLAIDQIDLRGVVKSDVGMIAVVVNSLDKAYFLRENDPVFNGYVVRITGDSIVFKETMQDKLGKPFTREVTKKITTPAV